MATEVFKITGMHCSSCGMLIDELLEELQGVQSSQTDVRRGETKVDFDSGAVNPSAIITAIEGAGYKAQLQEA